MCIHRTTSTGQTTHVGRTYNQNWCFLFYNEILKRQRIKNIQKNIFSMTFSQMNQNTFERNMFLNNMFNQKHGPTLHTTQFHWTDNTRPPDRQSTSTGQATHMNQTDTERQLKSTRQSTCIHRTEKNTSNGQATPTHHTDIHRTSITRPPERQLQIHRTVNARPPSTILTTCILRTGNTHTPVGQHTSTGQTTQMNQTDNGHPPDRQCQSTGQKTHIHRTGNVHPPD